MKTVVSLIAAIIAVALALVASEVTGSGWGQVCLLAALISAVMVAAVWYRAERRIPFLADPMVLTCAFFAQFYVIGPISLPLFDWHMHVALPVDLVLLTMVAFLVLLVCFVTGYQIRLGTMIAERFPDFSGEGLKLPGRIAESFVLLASIVGCWAYIDDRGGLLAVLGRGYGVGSYFSGLYQIPFHTLIVGTLMMCWRIADSTKPTTLDRVLFGSLLFGELIFYGIILGTRNRLFYLFFGLYTIWALRRGISFKWKLATIPILAFMLAFFSFWGSVRARPVEELLQGGGTLDSMYAKEAAYMGYISSVAEPFAVACMLMDLFPSAQPFRHGSTLLVTLLGFIPRQVWADKPIGFGKEVTKFTDGVWFTPTHGHSLTVTFLGDFWVNAGWLGVIVGGLVFGVIARAAASYATAGMVRGGIQTIPSRVLLAAVFVSSLAEVRGESATILMFWIMMGPVLIVACLFFRMDYSRRGALLGLDAGVVQAVPGQPPHG